MDDNRRALATMGGEGGKLIERVQQFDPELARRAVGIWSARPADNQITPQRALAAALYEQQTGQVCGRDFYIDEKMGVVPGYRGVMKESADAGAGPHQEEYRPFTADENEEYEIKPGDTARVCELTQVNGYHQARNAGLKYRPVVGYGIVKAKEKVNSSGQPIQLKGGYTWVEKAKNRAYKAALRHAGYGATADEIIEDAVLNGVVVEVPEGAVLTHDQAERAVEQAAHPTKLTPKELRRLTDAMRGPEDFKGFGDDEPQQAQPEPEVVEDEVVEGEIVEQEAEPPEPASPEAPEPAGLGPGAAPTFDAAAVEFCQKHPKYVAKIGGADRFHLLLEVRRAGWSLVAKEHVDSVFEELEKRARLT